MKPLFTRPAISLPARLLGTIGNLATLAALAALTGCPEKRPDAAPPAALPSAAPATLPPPDWTTPPAPGPAVRWAPPAVDTWRLANGLTVWFLRQDQVPLASISLIVPRGAATDPAGKAGTTALMADMLDEGAGGLDALSLGDAFQRLGTDYEVSVGTDAVSAGVHLLADQADASLALLQTVLFKPDFPAAELERRKQQRIASLLAGEADPANSRAVVTRRMLFGDGYGGLPSDGVRGTVQKITLEDVKSQYQRVFTPDGAALIVVGALDKAAVEAMVAKYFAGWAPGAPVAPAALTPKPAEPGIYFIDHPGATQSAIAVVSRSAGANAPELYASLYYNWALGGAFMSRVNLKLREEKGYTYGARSSFSRWREAGIFSVGALVKAQFTRESITEIFNELKAAGSTRPISAQEIAEARGGLLLSFPGRFENMGAVAAQLAELPLYGRAPDWYTRWPAQVEGVTAAQVEALATGRAATGDSLVIIAGDRKTVEPTLSALNLPVHLCDAQGNLLTP